jgi:hypothetical protein
LAAAESLALVAGLLRQSFLLAGFESVAPVPLILAQRAFAAAAILALTAGDLRRFFGASPVGGIGISPPPAVIESIWLCSASICSLMLMMVLSLLVVRLPRFIMGDY